MTKLWIVTLLNWFDSGGWLPLGVVYGLVYAYVFGGPLA